MGRLEEEKAIINNKAKDYINYASDRGRFTEGNITLVTYYSKNEKASSYDIGLGNVVELIGNESPIKYNKIENVPLMNFDESQLSYDYDEDEGLDSNVELSALLSPGLIKPKPDDLFYLSIFNDIKLFRISNIEGSNIDCNFFYKIDFFLIPEGIEILEERQVLHDTYEVEYDSNNPNKFMLIKSSNIRVIEEINNIMNLLRENYIKDFFNERLNIFHTKNHEYDNNLMYFIKKNTLFVEKGTFYKNIFVEEELELDESYFKTIYYLLEKNKPCLFNKIYDSYFKEKIIDKERDTIFSRTYENFYQIKWNFNGDNIFLELFRDINMKKENDWITKLFLLFFKDNYIEDNDKAINMIETIKEEIEYFRFNIKAYILIPCFLFMFKYERNRLLELTNSTKIN